MVPGVSEVTQDTHSHSHTHIHSQCLEFDTQDTGPHHGGYRAGQWRGGGLECLPKYPKTLIPVVVRVSVPCVSRLPPVSFYRYRYRYLRVKCSSW
jgi:hypothetical protein